MAFIIGIFQFNCESEHKQVKWNDIKRNMYKSGSIFLIYNVVHYFNMTFEIYFLIRFTLQINDNSSEGKISFV